MRFILAILLTVGSCFAQQCANSNQWVVTFESLGGAASTNTMTLSTYGSSNFYWQNVRGMDFIIGSASAQMDIGGIAPVCRAFIPLTGTAGFEELSDTNQYWFFHGTSINTTSGAVGFWFYTTMPYGDTTVNYDILAINNDAANVFLNFDLINEIDHFRLGMESSSGFGDGTGDPIEPLLRLTAYWMCGRPNFQGTNEVRVYDSSTNLLGVTRDGGAVTTQIMSGVRIGNHSIAAKVNGYTNRWDGLRIIMSNNPEWPLLPNSPPPAIEGRHKLTGTATTTGTVTLN